MEQPVHERGRVLFESPLNSTEPGLVLLPNGAREIHEPDGEADRQKHERGDNGQPHVYFHDSLDNEINEKVRGPSRSPFIICVTDSAAAPSESSATQFPPPSQFRPYQMTPT